MGHREDLLVGARRCLEERGYARTTARDLVAASGTNLASIGYHFGSKEALLNEAIAASFREWTERVRELIVETSGLSDTDTDTGTGTGTGTDTDTDTGTGTGPDGPSDPTGLLAAGYQAMLTSFAEYRGLAVAFVEALAQAERQPELRDQLARAYADCRAQVARILTEFAGDRLPAQQARAFASFQIAVCDGLCVQWLLDPEATPSGAELAAALHDVVTLTSR